MARVLTFLLALALVLLAAFPAASSDAGAQDDAGSGADAPDAWEDALDVTALSFGGAHDEAGGDAYDWYRVPVPEGKGLRIELTPGTAPFSTLRAVTDEGRNLSHSNDIGWHFSQSLAVPAGLAAVRFAVLGHGEPGTYAIAVTPVDRKPQADGGYADDAPDDRDEAFEVEGPALLAGELRPGQGDQEDWYRVVPPAGKQVRVVLTPLEGDLRLASANDGGFLMERSENPGAGVVEVVAGMGRPSDGVRIGVRLTEGEGPYTLDLRFHDPPSLRPRGVAIAPEPLVPERTRLVTVTVDNAGGPADNTDVLVWASYDLGDRFIGRATVAIAPNGTAEVAFPWDTAGQAGHAEVVACVESAVDATNTDNRIDQGASVLAPLPVGADAVYAAEYAASLVVPIWPWAGYCLTWDPWTGF